jgi:hypothetical protein
MRIHLYKKSRKRRSKRSIKRRSKQSIKRRSKRSTKRRSKRSMKRRSKRSAKRKKYNSIIDGMFDEKGEHVEKVHTVVEPYSKPSYESYIIRERNKNSFPLLLHINRTNPRYIEGKLDRNQTYINIKMITILLDWINDLMIHGQSIKDESTGEFISVPYPRVYLYNTINYLKRYINTNRDIPRKKLQLVGIVCFILATINERSYKEHEYINYITDNSYTKEEAIEMEIHVLKSLNYEIGELHIPSQEYFFGIYKTLIPLTTEENDKAKFLLELPNFNYSESYLPSLIALASILLSKKINYSELSEDIQKYINLSEDDCVLLYKYIGELKKFYTEKFNGDYKDSIEKLFK